MIKRNQLGMRSTLKYLPDMCSVLGSIPYATRDKVNIVSHWNESLPWHEIQVTPTEATSKKKTSSELVTLQIGEKPSMPIQEN